VAASALLLASFPNPVALVCFQWESRHGLGFAGVGSSVSVQIGESLTAKADRRPVRGPGDLRRTRHAANAFLYVKSHRRPHPSHRRSPRDAKPWRSACIADCHPRVASAVARHSNNIHLSRPDGHGITRMCRTITAIDCSSSSPDRPEQRRIATIPALLAKASRYYRASREAAISASVGNRIAARRDRVDSGFIHLRAPCRHGADGVGCGSPATAMRFGSFKSLRILARTCTPARNLENSFSSDRLGRMSGSRSGPYNAGERSGSNSTAMAGKSRLLPILWLRAPVLKITGCSEKQPRSN